MHPEDVYNLLPPGQKGKIFYLALRVFNYIIVFYAYILVTESEVREGLVDIEDQH